MFQHAICSYLAPDALVLIWIRPNLLHWVPTALELQIQRTYGDRTYGDSGNQSPNIIFQLQFDQRQRNWKKVPMNGVN
jgi:hypothetical protein